MLEEAACSSNEDTDALRVSVPAGVSLAGAIQGSGLKGDPIINETSRDESKDIVHPEWLQEEQIMGQ